MLNKMTNKQNPHCPWSDLNFSVFALGTSFGLDQYMKERKISYQELVGIPMASMRAEQEVRFFHEMDRDHSGTVEWWEFASTMCVRVLGLRSQVISFNSC